MGSEIYCQYEGLYVGARKAERTREKFRGFLLAPRHRGILRRGVAQSERRSVGRSPASERNCACEKGK